MIDCLADSTIPPESRDDARGRRAYEAYCNALAVRVEAARARAGSVPSWESLPDLLRGGWVAVGRALKEET